MLLDFNPLLAVLRIAPKAQVFPDEGMPQKNTSVHGSAIENNGRAGSNVIEGTLPSILLIKSSAIPHLDKSVRLSIPCSIILQHATDDKRLWSLLMRSISVWIEIVSFLTNLTIVRLTSSALLAC